MYLKCTSYLLSENSTLLQKFNDVAQHGVQEHLAKTTDFTEFLNKRLITNYKHSGHTE